MKKYKKLFYPQCQKKLISLIIPCKDREELTTKCLQAIKDKTKNKEDIQVITITDLETPSDQQMIANIYNSLIKDGSYFPLINISRPTSAHINRDYYNLGNTITSSYFTWIIGNDVIIETQDWDRILYNKTKNILPLIEEDDKYFYIHINDDTHVKLGYHKTRGNCFPIISNNYSYKIRGPMPEDYPAWGADYALVPVYNKLGFEIIDLINDISVTHVSVHSQRAP